MQTQIEAHRGALYGVLKKREKNKFIDIVLSLNKYVSVNYIDAVRSVSYFIPTFTPDQMLP